MDARNEGITILAKQNFEVVEATAEISLMADVPAKLVLALGRGKTGKSVMLRWIAETAQHNRRLRIIDADPNNSSLANIMADAERPPSDDGEDRRLWIEKQIE